MLRKALVRKIPLWVFLIGVVAIASLFAGLSIIPSLLYPKAAFSISSSSHELVAQENAQNPLNLTLKSQNGFTGVVLLQTLSSSQVSTRFSPDTVPLGRISNSTLWIDPLSAGNYSITVVGTSNGVSHSIDVLVMAEGLGMSFSPTSLTLARNTSANATLTLSSLNGLTGNLNLPGYSEYLVLSAHENPYNMSLTRGGSVTTIMSVAAGPYAMTTSFPVTAQICRYPYSCSSPIPSPPGPLWNFEVNYNITVT